MTGLFRPSPRFAHLAILFILAGLLLAGCNLRPIPTVEPTSVHVVATWTATFAPSVAATRPPTPAPTAIAAQPTRPPTATLPPAPTATATVVPPTATSTLAPSPTATSTPTTAPTATPLPVVPTRPATATPAPTVKPLMWDARLTARGATVIPAQRQAGQGYWRLVQGQWFDVNDQPFAGKHHIFVDVLDASGHRLIGAPVRLAAVDVRTVYGYVGTEAKPGEPYAGNFVMSEVAPAYRVEPFNGAPADAVAGLGLGSIEFPALAMLTSYGFTWQWTPAESASPSAAGAGAEPDQALSVSGATQFLSAGQRIWYAFRYAGDSSLIVVQMNVNPPGAANFSIWTSDDVARWVRDRREEPTGRGTVNEGARGALVWSGNFNAGGTYYIVVDQAGQYTGSFSLMVTGTGVTLSGVGQ